MNIGIALESLELKAEVEAGTFCAVAIAMSTASIRDGQPLETSFQNLGEAPLSWEPPGLWLLPPMEAGGLMLWQVRIYRGDAGPGLDVALGHLAASVHYNHPLVGLVCGSHDASSRVVFNELCANRLRHMGTAEGQFAGCSLLQNLEESTSVKCHLNIVETEGSGPTESE